MSAARTEAYEIAVIGAGAAGLAAALALARDGRSVALLGPAGARRDGRTVALLHASWTMMEELGVAVRLARDSAPLAVMRLVDDTGSLFRQPPVEFRASELGLEAFGWNVENAALVEALAAEVAAAPAIRHIAALAEQIVPDSSGVAISGADFGTLRARLAGGGGGRAARGRAGAGRPGRAGAMPPGGLTAILSHSREHRDASTEFHTREGPCTLVPLPGRRSSLVWMVEPRRAETLAALDDASFARRVEERTHSMLGAMAIEGPRGAVPMGGLSVARFAAARCALVGEAAHVFPPIGAQGLNLGLRDVAALRDVARGADDPGAEPVLAAYDGARQGDVRMRTGAVDALNRSLLSDLLPTDLLRGAGLLALSSIGPLRRAVMRRGLTEAVTASR